MRRGLKMESLHRFIQEQEASKNHNLQEWRSLWSINNAIIGRVCPKHTVFSDRAVQLCLSNGPENLERILLDCGDVESMLVGEEVILMDLGKVTITSIKRDKSGYVAEVGGTVQSGYEMGGILHLKGSVKTKMRNLPWLPDMAELVKLTLVTFGPLISKKKLLKNDRTMDFVHCSRMENQVLGDSNMKKLQRGDIIYLVHIGYYRCDVPYSGPSDSLILFATDGSVPPGFTRGLAKRRKLGPSSSV